MESLLGEIRRPVIRNMLGVIQSDSVYTLVRGHVRWGVQSGCPICGDDQGYWVHFILWCLGTPRSADLVGLPWCVVYSGNFLDGRVRNSGSLEMRQEVYWGPEGSIDRGGTVATYGSSRHKGLGIPGWLGFYWGGGDPRKKSGPLQGPRQTAPRAEGYAVAKVSTIFREPASPCGRMPRLCVRRPRIRQGRVVGKRGRLLSAWCVCRGARRDLVARMAVNRR